LLSIIGCGNTNRSDDGAGVYVVQRLAERVPESKRVNVRIFDAGTGGMDVMFQARGSDALIIIDANSSGSEPGAIFEVPGETLATCPEPSFGLHDFRWNHALFAGRKIFKDDFPKDITVYLIEAQTLSLGLELSDVVKAAADQVVEKLVTRLKPAQSIHIRSGNLYVDHDLYKRFFPGIETIALLKRDQGFLVMPVFSQASGGRLLKMRNSAGDRVVTATDFLQECGLADEIDRSYIATWDSGAAALFVDLTRSVEYVER
jgi:hydrogenase maturation protease